jgi:hypothetical protein
VNGIGFDPSPDVAEVRWNVSDGPQLASAVGPNFRVAVTIPKVPNGLYAIVVLMRHPDGSLGNTGLAPFEVRGSAVRGASSGAAAATSRSSSAPWTVALIAGATAVALGLLGGVVGWRRARAGMPRPSSAGAPGE